MQEQKTMHCPQCDTHGGLVSHGVHPVYNGDSGLSAVQIEVLICRNCGHVQLQQVTRAL